MQAFLDLIAQGKVSVPQLITHRFRFSEAVSVFDRIANGELNQAVGIVFEYPEPERGVFELQPRTLTFASETRRGAVRLGQIGAGNYAKSMLMPHFPSLAGLSLGGICTTKGTNAEALARRYGFRRATTDPGELLRDPEMNAILVATRHDSHARYAAAALEGGQARLRREAARHDRGAARADRRCARRTRHGRPDALDRPQPPLQRAQPARARASSGRRGAAGDVHRALGRRARRQLVPGQARGRRNAVWRRLPFHRSRDLLRAEPAGRGQRVRYARPRAPRRELGDHPAFRQRRASAWCTTCAAARAGLERETVAILGGGRSARIIGFRRLILLAAGGGGARRLQPDLGQKAMLEAMVAQFSGAPGAADYTESFLVSAQALLAAQRSIAERRVVTMEPRFPFSIG